MSTLLKKVNYVGFTLVELSIVLVIIGLLIGGILVGQSLIESAKINAQIKQLKQYDVAVQLFENKFNCLPGDCANIFSSNGNGNGKITSQGPCSDFGGSGYHNCDNGLAYEIPLAWLHLYEGGIIKESYGNVYWGLDFSSNNPEDYFPMTELGPDGTGLNFGTNTRDGVFPEDHVFQLAKWSTGLTLDDTTLTAIQALAIDTKIDDSQAITGDVRAVSSTISHAFPTNGADGCVIDDVDYEYNIHSTKARPCNLDIRIGVSY